MSESILHIFAQFCEHDEARIIGNRAGLVALKAAIEQALADGKGEAEIMADDGEGYGCIVQMTNGAGLRKAGSHYLQRHLDGYFVAERSNYERIIQSQGVKIRALRALTTQQEA